MARLAALKSRAFLAHRVGLFAQAIKLMARGATLLLDRGVSIGVGYGAGRWLGRCRRLSKDWDKSIASAQAWILIAHIRRVTRHFTRS